MPLHSKVFLAVTTLVVPLVIVLLGVWQVERAGSYRDFVAEQRADLNSQLKAMSALPEPEFGGINTAISFAADGTTYVGDFALEKMREAIGHLDVVLTVAEWRGVLPPVVIGGGIAMLLIGVLVIGGAVVLAGVGTRSRPALLGGFSLVRWVLPMALIALVVITALAVVSAVLFEVAPLLRLDNIGRGQAYVLAIGAGLAAISIFTAWQALGQLRKISLLFEPKPYPLIAEAVGRAEAPGLWRLVEHFAGKLGAPVPDTIAVGLAEGFFVISGPVLLRPGGAALAGKTLHVPLAHLVFLGVDEVATIIGHELAHFAGEDTEYSQKFLPIYTGFERSLEAVAAAGRAQDGSLSFLAAPALSLGFFVGDRFHRAVQHWSRVREFEADRKSATLTSSDAAGRALLRHSATAGLTAEVTNFIWANPQRAPDDVVPMLLDVAQQRGLDDPQEQLGNAVAHPTDSHPQSHERLAAFGFALTPERLGAAMTLPEDGGAILAQYFADAGAVSRRVTGGLVAASRRSDEDYREALSATAGSVGEDAVELTENTMPIAVMMFVLAVPMLAGALWTALFGLPGFGSESWILVLAFGLCGGFIFLLGLQTLRRARTPFMRLYPDRVEHVHLDRPIHWADVRDLQVFNQAGTMVTTFLLKRTAPFPKRKGWGGRGRIILNPGAWIVTIRSVPPQRYKAKGYIDLIGRYVNAAAARHALNQQPQTDTP